MSTITDKEDLTLRYIGYYNEVRDALIKSSSEILNKHRQKAILDFMDQGIPTRKNENYKYTNLHPSFSVDYRSPENESGEKFTLQKAFRCDVPLLDTSLVTILNGYFIEDTDADYKLPEGVVLDSLKKIVQAKPELIDYYYSAIADTSEDPLVALNTAYASDGFFLYIPDNTVIKKPVQVINLFESPDNAFVTSRNLVVVGANAEVNLIICDHTLNLNRYLGNSVTEIFAGENSRINYYAVQNQHNQATNINSVFIRQQRSSEVLTFTASLHGGLVRNNLKIIMAGENAEANVFGISFLDRKQHVDNFTYIEHASPHCRSNQLYKNVLDEESTGAFSGRIHVLRDAQKTNAFQRNNNLLLTDKASMHTKPQLIIEADDVKCSHGATVGQIDENALFYLRARGLPEADARMMMMNAFAHEVIQEIRIGPLRDRIDELVEKRLRGEMARCHECAYNCEC